MATTKATTKTTAQKKQQTALQQADAKSGLTQAYQADRKKQPDIAPQPETHTSSTQSYPPAKQPDIPPTPETHTGTSTAYPSPKTGMQAATSGGISSLAQYLQGALTQYQGKTDEEIRKRAEAEVGSQYASKRQSLQQQYDTSDLALKQQAAGLGKTYDKQREASAEQYAKGRSQADRAMTSRGMQRSSYGMQTLANIDKAGAKAQQEISDAQAAAEADISERRTQLATQLAQGMNQLNDAQLADVTKRINELEDQDWQRRQATSQQAIQTALSMYGLGQTDAAQAQSASQFAQQLGLQGQSLQHQIEQDLWGRQFQEGQAAQAASQFQQSLGLQQQSLGLQQQSLQHQIDQDMWGRTFQEGQAAQSASQFQQTLGLQQQSLQHQIDQDMWGRKFQEGQAAQSASQFQQTLGLQQQSLDQSSSQFAQQLAASTGQHDQSYAWTVAQGILSQGQMPSAQLLAQAGISEEDAKKLMKQKTSGGGGGGTATQSTTQTTQTGGGAGGTNLTMDQLLALLGMSGQPAATTTLAPTPAKPTGTSTIVGTGTQKPPIKPTMLLK